jgi:hypothetical protein
LDRILKASSELMDEVDVPSKKMSLKIILTKIDNGMTDIIAY